MAGNGVGGSRRYARAKPDCVLLLENRNEAGPSLVKFVISSNASFAYRSCYAGVLRFDEKEEEKKKNEQGRKTPFRSG